jgi:hypothetical protein
VITVSATSRCSQDVWNIDLELVGTPFHGSTIFHNLYKNKAQQLQFAKTGFRALRSTDVVHALFYPVVSRSSRISIPLFGRMERI